MLSLCLAALRAKPLADPRPDATLLDLCDGPPLTVKEMTPLLGDEGALSGLDHVRACCLKCMGFMTSLASNPLVVNRIYLLKFDDNEENRDDATDLWEEFKLSFPTSSLPSLFALLSHSESVIRTMAGNALASALEMHPHKSGEVLSKLISIFEDNMPVHFAGGDSGTRISVLKCVLRTCSTFPWSIEDVNALLPFIITRGLRDSNTEVRIHSMDAGIALVNLLGSLDKSRISLLDTIFERHMKDEATSELEVLPLDYQREGLIVFIGALAKHMDAEDPKIMKAIETLFDALKTPSEAVQRAVSSCISPLIKSPVVKDKIESYIKNMLEQLVAGSKTDYGHRRGAAYGLAGIIKGLGISSLKTYGVLDNILAATTSKESPEHREGALFAIETLFDALKLLFEPYILLLLPNLLVLFSDKSQEVRSAAQNTSRTLMAKLSAHGVKILMPKVLAGLENPKWRTKEARLAFL
jgi:hypothetical protein